jgi:nuclear cap-binding protein subunit 1
MVPESYQSFLPEPPLPINKYEGETEGMLAEELGAVEVVKTAIAERASADEILEKLNSLPNPLPEAMDDGFSPHQISIFVTVLLNAASKSFTHLFSAVGKFQSVLKILCATDDGQLCLLRTVYEVWRNHQQLLVILVDKLLKAEIVSVENVANWIFSTEMSEDLMRTYVWEILFATIRKKAKAVTKQQNEIANEKVKLAKFEAEDSDKVAPDDADDIPSEDKIERMEEVLDTYQSELKNLFLIIFQRFIMLLSDHIQKCEAQGKTFKNYWFRWIIGRLQQVLFEFHSHTFNYLPTLKSLLFTSDVDQHILLIFKQFCSLRA